MEVLTQTNMCVLGDHTPLTGRYQQDLPGLRQANLLYNAIGEDDCVVYLLGTNDIVQEPHSPEYYHCGFVEIYTRLIPNR